MADDKIEKYSDLFNKKAFANLSTLMKDGSPQVTPVWFDYDGSHIRVNSALGRVKDKNIRRDPRVSLVVDDPSLPLRGFDEPTGRGLEIHGMAELAEISGTDVIRVRPVRVDSWNLGGSGHQSRFVG